MRRADRRMHVLMTACTIGAVAAASTLPHGASALFVRLISCLTSGPWNGGDGGRGGAAGGAGGNTGGSKGGNGGKASPWQQPVQSQPSLAESLQMSIWRRSAHVPSLQGRPQAMGGGGDGDGEGAQLMPRLASQVGESVGTGHENELRLLLLLHQLSPSATHCACVRMQELAASTLPSSAGSVPLRRLLAAKLHTHKGGDP